MMATATKTWLRLARRLGRDGNPLRRRADLIEAWLRPAAIVVFLVLCPVLAGLTNAWVRTDNAGARHAQSSWREVHAVLLRAAAGPVMTDKGANTWVVWTQARWSVDGAEHVGNVPAAAKTSAGSTVAVWLDRAGVPRTPPLTAGQVRDRVLTATGLTLGALALLLALLALLLRRALDRRRLAAWEAAWLAVGPGWASRA